MARIIDLTIGLKNGDRGVAISPAKRIETDGWNATTLNLYSHCGTHIDAPMHFAVTDQTIDQLLVADLVGPAWVVDIESVKPRMLIEPSHLGDIVDKLQAGDGLVIRTGWSRFYGKQVYRDELPRVSEELARWCVERKVRILGVEPPSVADVNYSQELKGVHGILLGGGVIIVEGLANLDQITAEKVTLIALPLKIVGGDGAPARVIAIEES